MHQRGLHPALEPAGALIEQSLEGQRGFLEGLRVECLDDVAGAGEAQAEIGVLGDVIGVPESDFTQRLDAKMRYYVAALPDVFSMSCDVQKFWLTASIFMRIYA